MGSIADNRSAPDAPPRSHAPTGAGPDRGGRSGRDPAQPGLAGVSQDDFQGDLARRMVERVIRGGQTSPAEALSALRSAFPESPLTVRVAALAMLIGGAGVDPMPR